MWIIALGAMFLGLVFLTAAVLGLSRTVIINPRTGTLLELGAGSFGLRLRKRHAFRDLGQPSVVRDDSSDGPPDFRVQISCIGRKSPIVIERYAKEADAKEAAARLADLLNSSKAPA